MFRPNPARRDERCSEVYEIQVPGPGDAARARPASSAWSSGSQAASIRPRRCWYARRRWICCGYPRAQHSRLHDAGICDQSRTLEQARRLMRCDRMRRARTRHPARARIRCSRTSAIRTARDAPVYDITFENVQAGERTSHLFRLANLNGGLVVGTGDLSELALGWCTYGVGDHMSHYNVNASVPKTLIQHLIRWVAGTRSARRRGQRDAAATSWRRRSAPSWCPPARQSARPVQDTEAMLGPYELHDFSLYYTLRFGYPPAKVAFLAYAAGMIRPAARGPIFRRRRATTTTSAISRSICGLSCSDSSSSASSSAARFLTRPKWVRAARYRRAAIGVRPATAMQPHG